MHFAQALDQERRYFLVTSNGGIALPVAGAIYWLVLGLAGFYLKPGQWVLLAFFTSGLIFPLGLLLQKPLRANLLVKTPLSGMIAPALMAMLLSWPVTIAASGVNRSLAPLALAIGMSLHWPMIGWLFKSRVCLLHAVVRAVVVSGIWYTFPADRFTVLPLAVAVIYGLTVWGLKWEVAKARQPKVRVEVSVD